MNGEIGPGISSWALFQNMKINLTLILKIHKFGSLTFRMRKPHAVKFNPGLKKAGVSF